MTTIQNNTRLVEIQQLTDPRYFIESFYFIVNKARDTVPFLFNRIQKIYYSSRTRYDLILKARKEGISSLILAIWLFECIFNKNTHAVVVSHEDDATKRLFQRVKFFLDTMGSKKFKFHITLDKDSEKQISFLESNSYFWIGTAGSRSFGRGDDITHLLLSEIAHYKIQDLIVGILKACVPTAWRVCESTANGVGESFHQLWEAAGDPKNNSPWKKHFFAWHDNPENRRKIPDNYKIILTSQEESMRQDYNLDLEQIYWYRGEEAELPLDKRPLMKQENPSTAEEAFIHSGRHVFPIEKLKYMLKRAPSPIWQGRIEDDGKKVSWITDSEGDWLLWKNNKKDDRFVIIADVCEGVTDGSWSIMTVFNRSTWEIYAEYRARIEAKKFGIELEKAGYYFNNSLLIPENNNWGHVSIQYLIDSHYPHIFNTTMIWPDQKAEYGFPTKHPVKTWCVSALWNAINDQTYFDPSEGGIHEMMNAVINETGDIVAKVGWLDRMMTRAIGIYCLKFVTLNSTYRDRNEFDSPIFVTNSAGQRRGVTGYR